MAFPVTLNGRTYTLADFSGTNYVDGFPDALEDFVTQAGNIYATTSTSSVAIGSGSKTFTVADSGKPYTVGTPLRIADAAAPATNWIDGIVTSYSGTTLVVNAVAYAGSGTKASWNINIGGGPIAYTGTLPIAQGGTGATTAADARTNLDTYSKAEADSRFLNVSGEASNVTMTGNVTIGDAGTDTLTINAEVLSDSFVLSNAANTEFLLRAFANGATELYYDNGLKLATTSTGVDVTGDLGADTATISGNLTVDTDTLFVDAASNLIGIGTSSPQKALNVVASSSSTTIGGSTAVVQVGNSSGAALNLTAGVELFGSGAPSSGLGNRSAGIYGVYEAFNAGGNAGALVLATNPAGTTSVAERMRITSAGNVGIGTSSPAVQLHATGVGRLSQLQMPNSAGTYTSGSAGFHLFGFSDNNLYFNWFDAGAIVFRNNGSNERMRIDSSGNVGIGTSSPSDRVTIVGGGIGVEGSTSGFTGGEVRLGTSASSTQSAISTTSTGTPEMYFDHRGTSTGVFVWRSLSSERMRIDSSGNLLVGATSTVAVGGAGSGIELHSAGYINTKRNSTGFVGHMQFFNPNGNVGLIATSGSSTSYNTTSDYRLKENVTSLTGAADRLAQIPVHRFNFIADPDRTVDGFLAHEVQEFVPEAITGTKDEIDDEGNPVYQGIDQSKLVPLLTAALQEALTEIADLKARITALEG